MLRRRTKRRKGRPGVLALGVGGHYMCLSGFAEEGEEDLELFWGEEFALGGVGGFGEFGHQWLIGMDFAGEKFSCTLLLLFSAYAIETPLEFLHSLGSRPWQGPA